ncbi:hypothetical protein P12x_003329 [Tundrisphaera lichenicola]|uniref:hypothetical protein n=1 Tax=Tundrisphaera lichenicola TaxID=2029860 RepID=UPI003EBA33B6
MLEEIEVLLERSGGDGDYDLAGFRNDSDEMDQLMQAWLLERGRSIDCLLLLEWSRRILTRMIRTDAIEKPTNREVKRLLRSIELIVSESAPIDD